MRRCARGDSFNGDYNGLISTELVPGAYGQDVITLCTAFLLGVAALSLKARHIRGQMIVLGMLGYLFYAYSIHTIEQMYTMWYLVYLSIFALTFWGIVFGVSSIRIESIQATVLPRWVSNISIAVALLQPLVFIPMWTLALIPLMQKGEKIESLFSIYIIDLVWVMPAFLILAWMLYRQRPLAFVLLPALFILGFAIIFSLVASEGVKPFFSLPLDPKALGQSAALSALFLGAAVLHMRKLSNL